MSYILDALKKSDQERKQDSPPNVHTVHGHPPSFNDSSRFIQPVTSLLALLLLVLLTGAGGYFLLRPEKPPLSPPGATATSIPSPTPSATANKEDPMVPPPEISLNRVPDSTEQIIPSQEPVPMEAPVEGTAAVDPLKAVENPPESGQKIGATPVQISRERRKILLTSGTYIPQATLPPPATLPETPSPLPLVKDLPANLRSQLPKFHFAGHTYSEDPAQRMIIINNNITREGDRIDLDTRLVEITWEGVVIDYKGIKFRVDTY